ncbi:unnamed protein product [marine sediment metagenome]|uniref:Uncharacterized protein n=1 Tax=marine sediment metagenome TaxID=412755 RepID=X1R5Z7_9ZZZZ
MDSFEWDNVRKAAIINGATYIDITHLDVFLDSRKKNSFLCKVKKKLCYQYPYSKIGLLSYGPRLEDMVEHIR